MFNPGEIAKDIPAICIIDNDFQIDTLTGNSQQAHRKNVMFVQRQSNEHKSTVENISYSGKKAEISKKFKEKTGELAKVTQHILSRGTSPKASVRRYTAPPINGSLAQKKRSMIHALARVDSSGDRQQVPVYSGMQACLNQSRKRSKAYYHSTYAKPSSKSVTNDTMVENVQDMRQKNISFLFMVGDLPTYVHIVELNSENSV